MRERPHSQLFSYGGSLRMLLPFPLSLAITCIGANARGYKLNLIPEPAKLAISLMPCF